ncbi:MAG: FAD-dependent oxidoreductase, partial [Candidatus Omnitrophica bacterium]|nr:FAD-dependent oxidoreductase [Candidatus Omnitrophota bacterium]
MKVVIIGGVAGGASCAARARRLSEDSEIIVLDRGRYVSFANCGLPYYVGDVIHNEKDLIVATPELFKNRFNIDVRLQSEAVSIDRQAKTVTVRPLDGGNEYTESYDALVLSPGAGPIRPPLEGIDLPGIFSLRTIPDSRNIRNWIKEHHVKEAAIVGGGFIGLEMADNLTRQGIRVKVIELQTQVMPPLDPEMLPEVEKHLKDNGVELILGDAVASFKASENELITIRTQSGKDIAVGMVILAIGVKPENALAKAAGLEIGARGGIRVDRQMRTTDPAIWAVGDAVETHEFSTGQNISVPLAGPANRQGRIAADVIFGRDSAFRGVQGTAVCRIFDYTVAMTGLSEKTLQSLKTVYQKIYLHPGQHVSYFPGAHAIDMKVLFEPSTGRILGAQAVGQDGVEKRIDVISMAIQMKATVFDLEEAELCYAPQFGAAKDPVNFAGMIAAN